MLVLFIHILKSDLNEQFLKEAKRHLPQRDSSGWFNKISITRTWSLALQGLLRVYKHNQ
jgi:hypothetical protein